MSAPRLLAIQGTHASVGPPIDKLAGKRVFFCRAIGLSREPAGQSRETVIKLETSGEEFP